MGGSTNTVLHILAAAHEGEVDFTMEDIDRLSRNVPVLCKVAPAKSDVHMEDVHRAGGIMAILGELDRAGLIDRRPADGAYADARRRARPLGHRTHRRTTAVRDLLPGGAGRRADPDGVQPGPRAGTTSTSTGRRASSAAPSILSPEMVGWRC